jgi:protein O-GlcNAc transferase
MAASGPNQTRKSLPEIYQLQVEAAERESREKWKQSLAKWLAALRENPNAPETYIEIAQCHRKLKVHEAAIAILADGIKHCDFHARLRLSYIHLLAQCNRTREAIAAAHEASLLLPQEFLWKVKEACLLPIIYQSPEEVDRYRRRFTEGLLRLSGELRLDTPDEKRGALSAIGNHVNVHLGYQGRNDRELQVQYGEMVHRIMAANYPQWTVTLPVPSAPSDGALRVGYISSRFRNLSATKYFLGWLRGHRQDKFAVYAYHAGGKTETTTGEVRRASRHFRQLSDSLEESCKAILADQLHILVFLDVGMAPVMTQLAALRLAPIQCAAWDQPVTTGLSAVDYFLSSDLAEPEDARDHYSETLIKLPGTGTCYQKPVIPTVLLNKTRRDFRIREDAAVYLCCQYAFKYPPDQDDCFVQIAKRVPNSQFVFLTPNVFVARDFRERLDRAFSAAGLRAGDYCVLLPEVERFTYWNLNLLGDVVLDTLDWSGGVSTFEAIACRLPVVTLPGKVMRGRQSYAILKQLGVTETIARDKADYVEIAARLGLDRQWRDSVVEKMIANYSLLYSDKRCVEALEEFYRRAVDERLAAYRTGPGVSRNAHK